VTDQSEIRIQFMWLPRSELECFSFQTFTILKTQMQLQPYLRKKLENAMLILRLRRRRKANTIPNMGLVGLSDLPVELHAVICMVLYIDVSTQVSGQVSQCPKLPATGDRSLWIRAFGMTTRSCHRIILHAKSTYQPRCSALIAWSLAGGLSGAKQFVS
jgi:hypothetical protein